MGDVLRTKVFLDITTTVELTDAGYLGGSATVEEHVARAKNNVKNWVVFIKKNAADPGERVSANISLRNVIIEEA